MQYEVKITVEHAMLDDHSAMGEPKAYRGPNMQTVFANRQDMMLELIV